MNLVITKFQTSVAGLIIMLLGGAICVHAWSQLEDTKADEISVLGIAVGGAGFLLIFLADFVGEGLIWKPAGLARIVLFILCFLIAIVAIRLTLSPWPVN